MFLNCSSFHHVNSAGSKLSVLKHRFVKEILVTLLQHRVVFFNKKKQLAVTFLSEAEPQNIQILGKFEPRCSCKIVLIKKRVIVIK